MRRTDTAVMAEALARLRDVNGLLDDIDAGICLIHLDACIAALESRLRKLGVDPDQAAQMTSGAMAGNRSGAGSGQASTQ
jgi:hypothetical protein